MKKFIIGLNRIGRLKHWIEIFLVSIYKKKYRKKFVIKNKLPISYGRGKSMHYPESPKVSVQSFPLIIQNQKCPNILHIWELLHFLRTWRIPTFPSVRQQPLKGDFQFLTLNLIFGLSTCCPRINGWGSLTSMKYLYNSEYSLEIH